MIGKPHRILDRFGAMVVRRRRPLDKHDRQAENARGDDLAMGRLPAGILADDDVDAVIAEQRHLRLHREGPAGEDILHLRRLQRRIDGIDAAYEIMVLRRGIEGLRLLPTDGEEHTARRGAERCDGLGDRADAYPAVALRLFPAGALEPQERQIRRRACRAGIGGDLPGKGVGGVDQQIDGVLAQKGRKPLCPAETAGAHRHGLRHRIERAAGKRQGDGEIGPVREPFRQIPRFRRAAQDKDALLVHV